MKKVAIVFIVGVFVPSLVLAWLAMRSLRDQQFLVERQQSLLYQGVTDSLAQTVTDFLSDRQQEFGARVDAMLTQNRPRALAPQFDTLLRSNWALADVGFCVTLSGEFRCPQPMGSIVDPANRPAMRDFFAENNAFFGNRESAEVYLNQSKVVAGNGSQYSSKATPSDLSNSGRGNGPAVPPDKLADSTTTKSPAQNDAAANFNLKRGSPRNVNPIQQMAPPAQIEAIQDQAVSRLVPAEGEFRQLVGDLRDGMVARFLQNKLTLMFWHRPGADPQLIFGAQLDLGRLVAGIRDRVRVDPTLENDICVALLDDNAKPVALSHSPFTANWRRPFVATEIGEALPHWEMAAYLLHPDRLTQTARTVRLTLGLLIGLLVLAIGIGSWLIVTDLNRQLRLTRQQTDFVSNVSHELKTPLTSIRMFSELLAEDRVADPAKRRSYLNIITAETARLTRLINNVLDFSRQERGEKKYEFGNCDLVTIARDTAESYRPHLENNGFTLDCEFPPAGLPVRGDADALAQVLVNLLSNAEKYSGTHREVVVRAGRREGPLPCAEVQVLDRGAGVPRGSEEKIFEKFYRAYDSLSSGTQGSGLGLTLARQIARAHGGDIAYEPRDGGGSCFSLRLPLTREAEILS